MNAIDRTSPRNDDIERTEIFSSPLYQDLKFRVLGMVYEYLEQDRIPAERVNRDRLRADIARTLSIVSAGAGVALNGAERERFIDEVAFEVNGLGPLEPLLADDTVDDIIVNGPDKVYVERAGELVRVRTRFRDSAHLMNIIQRIVSPLGRRVDETSPFVDARLKDGSRVNIVVPPVTIDGPSLSIRKFRKTPLKAHDMVRLGTLSEDILDYLCAAVRARLNVLICGGTGSGKTTLLNLLSGFIGATERLVTIEDAAELQLRQPHVVRMETRPPTVEGLHEITARDLMRNTLRMRPDRIILGEVRGVEAVEMIQAMTTGHDGSMTTLHANTARDALSRLELLLGFGGVRGDVVMIRRQIVSAVQIVVHVQRGAGGVRRVTEIVEVAGMEGDTIVLNEQFRAVGEAAGAPDRFVRSPVPSRFPAMRGPAR